MADFTYEATMKFSPEAGKRGQPVTVEVQFSHVAGQIQRVYMTVPGYGIMQNLTRKTDQVFILTMPVPWEAPSGNYTVQIHAVAPDQQRGPVISQTYTIS